jgi:hypothetical protein
VVAGWVTGDEVYGARKVGALVAQGDLTMAQAMPPAERPYQLPAPLCRRIGITRNDQQE